MLLHRRRHGVVGPTNVLQHNGVQVGVVKRVYLIDDLTTGDFDVDIRVAAEVDAGRHTMLEEVLFRLLGSGNIVARTTSPAAAADTTTATNITSMAASIVEVNVTFPGNMSEPAALVTLSFGHHLRAGWTVAGAVGAPAAAAIG